MYPYFEPASLPKRILKLQRLERPMEKLHHLIVDKHISVLPLDEDRAIHLSNKRKQFCSDTGNMVIKNHVFENPKVLIRARVIDPSWEKYYNKVIYVSKQKLKLIQSEKDIKTSDWTAKEIDPRHAMFADKTENYHLLTEFLSYDEIKFVSPDDRDCVLAEQSRPNSLSSRLSRKRRADNAPKSFTRPTRFSVLGQLDDNEE